MMTFFIIKKTTDEKLFLHEWQAKIFDEHGKNPYMEIWKILSTGYLLTYYIANKQIPLKKITRGHEEGDDVDSNILTRESTQFRGMAFTANFIDIHDIYAAVNEAKKMLEQLEIDQYNMNRRTFNDINW